jgi:hypothetical protein
MMHTNTLTPRKVWSSKCNLLKFNKENSFQLTPANALAADYANTPAPWRKEKASGIQYIPEYELSAWHPYSTSL